MTGREETDRKLSEKIKNKLKDYPEYVKGYCGYDPNMSIRTLNVYINRIIKFLNETGRPIEQIRKADILNYINAIGGMDSKQPQKAGVYSTLMSFFDYLTEYEYIEENPMRHGAPLKRARVRPKDGGNRTDYLTAWEIKKFMSNIQNGIGSDRAKARQRNLRSRDLAIAALFLSTGMRCSALVELNMDNIDFDEGTVTITTKGSKHQTFNMNEKLSDYIGEWLDDRDKRETSTEAVFITESGRRMTVSAVEDLIKKYSANIEGKTITPHKLRATFATQMRTAGKDLLEIMDLMGHASLETTKIYLRGRKNNSKEAADIMARYL